MPDEKRIHELTAAPDVDEYTLLEVSVVDTSSQQGYSSYNGALGFIFDKILKFTAFTQRLKTSHKTVFDAINEVAEDHNIANQFSTSATYAVDDYAIYEGTLYKCISAVSTAGAWDSTKWTAVIVTDEMGSGGGGSANMTELTQAEYDALEQAGQLVEDMMYFITDGQSGGGVVIDDSTTSASKVWSSQKTDSEIQSVASDVATKQDDLSCGQLANVDLDDYKTNGFYWVSQTNVSNKPATNFGYLIVAKPSTVIQIFIAFANDSTISRGDMYVRFYANNQWYGWNKIASSRPEPVKASRTGLTIAAGTTSYFTFSGVAVKSGYTRMVTCANPSEGGLYYLRTVENGDDLRIYINNALGASVTFDLTIMVEYVPT